MPSFLYLLKWSSKLKNKDVAPQPRPDSGVSFEPKNEPAAKSQRRFSSQTYLNHLRNRSPFPASAKAQSNVAPQNPESRAPDRVKQNRPISTSPLSATSNSNKPLPPPPPPDLEPPVAVKPPQKLKRILTTLSVTDVHNLFSGAPHFFARAEDDCSGKPVPSVSFPWDNWDQGKFLKDHGLIRDEAWACVTALPPNADTTNGPEGIISKYAINEGRRQCFTPLSREKPNMLSMIGVERGTMGYEAALELSVADALQDGQGWSADPRSRVTSEHRAQFLHSEGMEGVRAISEKDLLENLVDIQDLYQQDPSLETRPNLELYTLLFTRILYPPTRVIDSDDPYSIEVQIDSLVKVLATPNVWVDFGLVEWRIRLGQMLWSPQDEYSLDDDDILINGEQMAEGGGQKYWLLLQVLLACELLVRLDSLKSKSSHFNVNLEESLLKEATRSVRWSLLVARCWLENIRIEMPDQTQKKEQVGWLSAFMDSTPQEPESILDSTKFTGRHQERQANGLVHFAQSLDWPRLNTITSIFLQTHLSPDVGLRTSTTTTPMTTTTRSSYFGRRYGQRGSRKQLLRMTAVIHPSGWLSRSYLSGLVLPGEALAHFLMSTLLENDETAVQNLGEEANLYGGFAYSGKSFWSTACIVGRVLAAGKGSRECMGWISSDVVPQDIPNSWFNLKVDLSNFVQPPKGQKDTLTHDKDGQSHDSSIYGFADISSLLPGDFTLVHNDCPPDSLLDATLEALDLLVEDESEPPTPTEPVTPMSEAPDEVGIRTYSAVAKFSVKIQDQVFSKSIALSHDVYFVTGHPCVPTDYLNLVHTPASPQLGFETPDSSTEVSTIFRGHPLHKSYNYIRYNLSSIIRESLDSTNNDRFEAVLNATLSSPQSPILVVDCTESAPPHAEKSSVIDHAYMHSAPRKADFGSDVEMLARAWCAERGVNAIISRKGRNCIACSIREARMLEWKVVLRFG